MSGGQEESAVKLKKGVSVTVGAKTYRGECPGRLLPAEHKLRKVTETKRGSTAKASSKAD